MILKEKCIKWDLHNSQIWLYVQLSHFTIIFLICMKGVLDEHQETEVRVCRQGLKHTNKMKYGVCYDHHKIYILSTLHVQYIHVCNDLRIGWVVIGYYITTQYLIFNIFQATKLHKLYICKYINISEIISNGLKYV